ncbi:MAG: peptidoglycan editing factor PgeF [Nitrospiraceae bacterium]|nr:MAG: peptidoglycan editing factor PgeF [Nitrospiraceae bacterium]
METIIKPPNINSTGIRAFFTSRHFCKSHASIKEALLNESGCDKDKVYLPVQKHTNNVHVLDLHFNPVVADAVITKRTDVLIGVIVADCVPVLIYDRARKVIGAVHAGWRGTADGILPHALLKMNNLFNSRPDNVLVAIGPSIGKCSYEVNTDVKDAVENKTGKGNYYEMRGDKFMMDLAEANRIQALNSGVSELNIWKSDECTFCNPDKFYSYRYAKETDGRQGGFIGMW